MKVSKVLSAVVCLIMIVSMAQAKVIHGGKVAGDTLLIIPKTSIAPKIDGKVDPIWNLVDATWMQYLIPQNPDDYPTSWSDFAGWVKLMYDNDSLYGLWYIQDDVIDTTANGASYQWDAAELFIDANHTHAVMASLGANPPAAQYVMKLVDMKSNLDSAETAIGKGLHYNWFRDTASISDFNLGGLGQKGYFIQFAFPLDSLGLTGTVAGKQVSMQFQTDDNDYTSEYRTHVMNWNYSPGNSDWFETLSWGNAEFSTADPIDTTNGFVFLKTSTPPVIDGLKDAVWDQANQLTVCQFQDQTENNHQCTPDPQNNDWRFYGLYDNNNIYGLFTVYDDVIDSVVNGASYQWDAVEFFVDASHTHKTMASLSANPPAAQYVFKLPDKIDSAAAAVGKGLKYKWTKFNWTAGGNDTVFSSRTGWQLEFQMSLDSLGFTTTAQGTQFSFQLQVDDNDLTSAFRILTSNWWYSPGNSDWFQTLNWGNAVLGPSTQTGVKEVPSSVAKAFALKQNYPNPFNPTTQISYSVAQTGFTTLKVYNVLGQEVATLFAGVAHAGQEYTATFDGSSFASGVYFYKLQAGNQMLVKKLMLLK
jgi:hypothetical protein